MAESTSAVGGLDDRVRLRLGGDEMLIAESWVIGEGVLAQPSTFQVTFGQAAPIAKTFTIDPALSGSGSNALGGFGGPKYPKGTKVELFIGDDLQMTGRLEGFHAKGRPTTVTIKGRDALVSLYKAHSEAQRSFIDGTYTDLAYWAILESGIKDFTILPTNAANRKIKTGIPVDEIEGVTTVDEINQVGTSGAAGPGTTGTLIGAIVHQEHQNRINESLLSFVRRHLDRAGLFLWAAADGQTFILSQPNGKQEPIYRILNKRGSAQASNVIDLDFTDDSSNRHSGVVVYGRGGGKKAGRAKAKGAVSDPEMISLGMSQEFVLYRDVNVQNVEQAEFFAHRKCAEERRNGWNLTYTVRGHRLDSIHGGNAKRPVVTPDTTVYVEDDEIGVKGVFYVESVVRRRQPETVTDVRLMRLEDLIFATGGVD